MTEVDFEYSVRDAVDADHRFVMETTARVRQPHGMPWADWEPYGMTWSADCMELGVMRVVEAKGVILGFVLARQLHVEMLYVKKSFRGLGLGLVLLDAINLPEPLPVRAPTDSFRIWASKRGIRFTVVP